MADMRALRFKKSRFAAAFVLFGLFSLLLYQFGLFVMVLWLSVRDPATTAFMDAARKQMRTQHPEAEIEFVWVPYEQISVHLKRAVVASEDSNFLGHGGVEWDAIRQAWEYNRRQSSEGATRRRGGSTITQQLAKNLFLSSSRSYLRKGQELLLAYMIEATMSKQRILELYLNVAQWGQYTFGAEAAARKYYKAGAANLGPRQAARLAAMLPNPAFYEKNGETRYLLSRINTIQQRMRLVSVP